jgi:hypothetical protein
MAKCVWVLEREEITTHICEIQETDVRGWLSMVMSSMEQVDLTECWSQSGHGTQGKKRFMKNLIKLQCQQIAL